MGCKEHEQLLLHEMSRVTTSQTFSLRNGAADHQRFPSSQKIYIVDPNLFAAIACIAVQKDDNQSITDVNRQSFTITLVITEIIIRATVAVLAARAVQEHRGAAEETGNIQRYLS